MNKKHVRKNYIWLDCNSKKLYLHDYNSQVIKIFSEIIIKDIYLFVTYDIYNKYNICYSKPDDNAMLKNSKLFDINNKLRFFFDYFKKKKLNCVEFEIELVDGTLLKTFYVNDLIVFSENIAYFNQIIELMPSKLHYYFSEKSYFKANLIQYTNDSIIRITPVNDIEEFLFSNESYFFNNQ